MTPTQKETTEKLLEELTRHATVMRAFLEGRTVEYRPHVSGAWHTCANPLWDWANYDYRVAPKVVETWVIFAKDTTKSSDGTWRAWMSCPTELEAKAQLLNCRVSTAYGKFYQFTYVKVTFDEPEA